MSQSSENLSIEDGLDRQNLKLLQQRFESINKHRLQRLREALNPQQQFVLQCLQLLFHSNHPMLPGYVSQKTPARLAKFKADKEQLRLGKSIAKSFSFRFAPLEPDILGIYVMGSVGTIAQTGKSDLDIWLCHKADLDKQQKEELKKKCEGISAWAANKRLEIHFFPMDAAEFRHGNRLSMDCESSGSTQQLFLLDEFYRSAIHLGGRIPLWWFIPPQEEHRYNQHAQTLLHRRFLRSEDVLDFGGVDTFADSEYVSAGIWQLYKAIESPYKSILKMLLLEAYASEQPNITTLSSSFKKLVYQGVFDIDQLDSYLLSYQRIEQYLIKNKQQSRLEVARRCFYFKVNRPLSKPLKPSWQRQVLTSLVEQWQWSQSHLASLDNRENWKVTEVSQERSSLVSELNRSYQFLLDAISTHQASRSVSGEEITILGRKLQAAFERRPGKIEWINPGITKNLRENVLSLKEQGHDQGNSNWLALSLENNVQQVLQNSPNLVELLLWCLFNGVCDSQSNLDLDPNSNIGGYALRKLLSTFQSWLPARDLSSSHKNFQSVSRPTQILILLNLAEENNGAAAKNNRHHLDINADTLHNIDTDVSLVRTVDLVSYNSWHELSTKRFEGDNALLDTVNEYLHLCAPDIIQAAPALTIENFGSSQALSVSHRVRNLFEGINQCFYNGQRSSRSRYIFKLSKQYHCLQPYHNSIETRSFNNKNFLMNYLSLAQPAPSKIVLDPKTLQNDPLKAIIAHITPPAISVIYRRFDFGWELFVADEKGSLQHFVLRGGRDYNPLVSLHRFLRNVIKRETLASDGRPPDFGVQPLSFYELTQSADSSFVCAQRSVPSESRLDSSFEVKANAHFDKNDQVVFDFYCDDQVFSALSLGEQLDLVVAQFIVSRRESGESYPVYLADLDLSLCRKRLCKSGQLQTSHYLRYKKMIEKSLNQSIGRIMHP